MAERLDAVTAREYTDRDGNKKTQWTKIGAAWPTKTGGWSISLEALPLPTLGERGLETRILLMEPKSKDGERQRRSLQPRRDRDDPRTTAGFSADLDDEILF